VIGAYLFGFAMTLVVRPRVESRNLRPVVLTIAALTGMAAIVRAAT